MSQTYRIPHKANIFAPMEGITSPAFRRAILKLFPTWDILYTDFLRVPVNSTFKNRFIKNHIGQEILSNDQWTSKTVVQILASITSNTEATCKQLADLGITKLDLNIGCPSKKVNSHKGGAYLLSNLKELQSIVKNVRNNFPGYFSVKIRAGYKNDDNFESILKIIEGEGAEAVAIHGRTQAQLFKGVADWDYIAKAVDMLSIPVIGNGDINSLEDIKRIYQQTNCHAVMIGRMAVGVPWLISQKPKLQEYFATLEEEYLNDNQKPEMILKRFKAITHYIESESRTELLRSKDLEEFKENLKTNS